MVLSFRKFTVHQLCQSVMSMILGKVTWHFEPQLYQMLILWQQMKAEYKGIQRTNLCEPAPQWLFKYNCLLNIDVFYHWYHKSLILYRVLARRHGNLGFLLLSRAPPPSVPEKARESPRTLGPIEVVGSSMSHGEISGHTKLNRVLHPFI